MGSLSLPGAPALGWNRARPLSATLEAPGPGPPGRCGDLCGAGQQALASRLPPCSSWSPSPSPGGHQTITRQLVRHTKPLAPAWAQRSMACILTKCQVLEGWLVACPGDGKCFAEPS